MTLSMSQASVPVFLRTLQNLRNIVEKAARHAESRKIKPAALLNARLYPDMFDLTQQVQIATDFARGTVARLAGVEPPSFTDNEQSFEDLLSRIDRSVAYVQSVRAADIDGSETREIVRPLRGEPHRFTGLNYLFQFALPNFFFHATTAYAILRHNGIEVGKADFIGQLD